MSNENVLASFYPFLHGQAQDEEQLDAALLRSVEEGGRLPRHQCAFFAESGPALVAAARALAQVYRGGGRLFTTATAGPPAMRRISRSSSRIPSPPAVPRWRRSISSPMSRC